MTLDLQKVQKFESFPKNFLLETIKKVLIPVLNNILGSFCEF